MSSSAAPAHSSVHGHMWPPMGQHGAGTFHAMETLQAALVRASRTCSLGNITRHSLGLSRRGVLLRRTQQSGGASLLQGEGAEGLTWDRKGAARPDASCPGETGVGPPCLLQHLVELPSCLPCPRSAQPVPTSPSSMHLPRAFAHGHRSLDPG